jgi:radical SAM protein with 4Fe4S-binding SPASM domain
MIKPDLEGVKNTLQEYPFPVDVIVEVTRYCNLRCIMCPYPHLKRPKGEMKVETFKTICDEIAAESPSTRVWLAIMGEPLLIKDRLIEMIKYAKKVGIHEINLNTNAVFMTEEMSKKLIESGVDKILVSIDGMTEATYNKIRVGGDFNTVIKNVAMLLKLKKMNADKPEVIAQFIVMEENETEANAFREFWLERGAVVKVRPKLGWGNAVQSTVLDKVSDETERFACSWLTRTVSIHWDGSFAQCDADHEGTYSPGHLEKQTIKQLWKTEIARRREKHWKNDFDFEPCKNCKDWLAGRSYFYYPKDYKGTRQ